MSGVLREVSDHRATHEAICADVKKGTVDLEREATEAHEKTRSHRERCRRITKSTQDQKQL